MNSQELFCALAFAFLVGLGCLSNYLTHHINVQVLTEENEVKLDSVFNSLNVLKTKSQFQKFHPEEFIASRSYNDLKILNDFGPKATGSIANEIYTVDFLMRRAEKIKDDYANVSEISIDLHVVSGVHFVSAHYRNIQNVVVKLHGKSDSAVMVNCHFDSEAGSYGAGDDGVNCCIMIEMLRVMAKSGRRNAHSIIFLFNGSEEGNLEGVQASHGFITQHKWAKDIKAYVNLEAQGMGGREILFRSGPRHNWLIEKYRQSVPNPFGQVFAEDMFETNVLKSGTDFESFRDAGHIPGLDISYCSGGWKYHTVYDHIRYMTNESIQNTGNNILPLVQLLANSDEILNPPEGTAAVFYDFLGLFFVSYTASVGNVLNIAIAVVSVVIPFVVQIKCKLSNLKTVLTATLTSFATFTISTILSLAACFGIGLIINSLDNSMFWFNTTILSLGVYSVLAVIVQIAVHHVSSIITKRFSDKGIKGKFTERKQIHAQLNGINLFWALLTITITSFGFRFAYIIMIILLISIVTNIVMYLLHIILPETRLHSWIFLHFAGHSFSFMWTSYLLLVLWKIFIPITEKTYSKNPEATISLLCGLISIMSLSYFIPLTNLLKTRVVIYTSLITMFVVSLVLTFTSSGFPYSGSIDEPRVQRHYITHTKRTFYDSELVVKFTDIGYFIKENERNSKRTLDLIFPPEKLLLKSNDSMCKTEAFCGFPSYNNSNAFWMHADESPSLSPTGLNLTSRIENQDSIEMSFEISGNILTLIYLTPEPDIEIIKSSIEFNQFEWIEGRTAKYLKITYGKQIADSFSFTVTVEKPTTSRSDLLKLTIVTLDSHFDSSSRSSEFENLISKFPDYTFIQTHQADVSSYTFQ